MDRGYVDFERLARLDDAGSFFVTRAKSNLNARRRYSRPVILVAIVKKRLALPATLYEILQILSLTLFEKTPVNWLFDDEPSQKNRDADTNQLTLFS